MKSQARLARGNYTVVISKTEEDQEISDMAASVAAVEKILNYRFNRKKLLEDALTHPSFTESASYQRLEFVGDAALGLAFSHYAYLAYPDLEPGKLSLVRAANICTEHLARVSVRKGLYNYVRHSAAALDDKVKEFVSTVNQEDGGEAVAVYGGKVKAPKVLADIVESISAAVYVDCNFDLKAMWPVINELLEPLVMMDVLEHQPQPVTLLFEICQKDGKQVGIDYARDGEKNVAIVTVDGQFVAKASSVQKENAKFNAAKAALEKLCPESSNMTEDGTSSQLNGHITIEGAKQKLHEICGKKKWPRPKYKIVKESGCDHDRRYVCSVEIEVAECILVMTSQEKVRVREAENCAASSMIHSLRDSCYL